MAVMRYTEPDNGPAALAVTACLLLVPMLANVSCGSDAGQLARPVTLSTPAAALRHGSLVSSLASARVLAGAASDFSLQLQESQQLGQLEIPRIGVREWIVQGTSEASLKRGAGHLDETPLPGLGGNFTIAGDRVLFTAPFLRLDDLQVGDVIVVHMPYGEFRYAIESITVNSPEDVSVILPRGYESLTLSTCDPPWGLSSRLTIGARLTVAEPAA